MAQSTDTTGYERLGEKKLKLTDAIAQSVGFMGPVFSAAFLIPLIAGLSASGKGAGIATPFAVLLAAAGTFALGWVVAQYAKKVHAAGSLYDYVSSGLGGTVGGFAGWLYYGGTTVLASAIACLIGFFMEYVIFTAVPEVPGVLDSESPLPGWAWSLIFVIGVFLLQYLGVKISTRVQLALAAVSVVAVLLFFFKVILDAPSNSLEPFNPSSAPDLTSLLFGVMYGVLIFVGFETAANLGEETADPKRSIPKAVLMTVLIATGFYLIASYAQVAGFGFDLAVLTDPAVAAAPLFALASPADVGGYGSTAILDFIIVVVFLDVIAVGIGAAVASSHGIFALARDRRLPGALAKVSGRGTPVGAISTVAVVSLIMVALAETQDGLFALPVRQPHFFEMFAWLSTFGAFAIMVVYGLMALGAYRGLSDHPKRAAVWIAATAGLLIALGAVFGAVYKQVAPNDLVWKAFIVWAVIGLIVTLTVKGREPASQVLDDLRG
jgi:amino acid transporter